MLPGGTASCYPVGVAILGAGAVLNVVGVATPEWVVSPTSHQGLWKWCQQGTCYDIPENSKSDVFKVCETFAILGVIASGAAFVSALLYLVLPMLNKSSHKILNVMALLLGFAGAVFIVICLSTWAAKVRPDLTEADTDLGYSFFLSVAGLCLVAIGSPFVFFQGRRFGSYSLIGD
ncbi:unnamed protein product [Lymnaea stagnalis]|uniref:Claudin n=1 Tax=Lymnaea stagnalis TaxID=6523 RepID=A0AAV2IQZ7_LYMST